MDDVDVEGGEGGELLTRLEGGSVVAIESVVADKRFERVATILDKVE